MVGKYVVSTLGCKVNQYETQQLREVLESCGFRAAGDGEPASVAVINTCAVTAEAVRKNRRAVRKLACGGQTPVVVVGCGAAADAQRLGRLAGVAAVLGHDADVSVELRRLLEQRFRLSDAHPVGESAAETSNPSSDAGGKNGWIKPVASRRSFTSNTIVSVPLPVVKTDDALLGRIDSFHGHQRAFLKIQDGCDAHCTYCIIPRLRPRLRSKPIEVAVAEARDLVRTGHREIVLTGIFLGAYGRPTALRKRFAQPLGGPVFPDSWVARSSDGAVYGRLAVDTGDGADAPAAPLPALLRALARVEGLERIRLSSLEPGDVDEELLAVLAENSCCVPHLHLPLQSGGAEVLRRMNRQYSRDAFIAMVDQVRAALDRPSITTDVIVGFPGETDADFEATLEIARYAEFSKIHAFPFSPREGTAAARWQKEFVPRPIVRERMARLAALEAECSLRYRSRLIGVVERVIVEPADRGAISGESIRHGRTGRYFEVHFEAPGVRTGELVQVRIDHVTPGRTHGTYLPGQESYPLPVLSARCGI